MYANLLGSLVVDCSIEAGLLVQGNRSIPMVDAIGTVDDKHSVFSIALVNRHPSQKAECEIQLKDILLDGTFDATVLAGDSPDAYNSIENPQRVVGELKRLTFKNNIVKLPPHSLTIVKIPVK